MFFFLQKKQSVYNNKNAEKIAEKQRERRRIAKRNRTQEDRFALFNGDIGDGPIFVCFSCHRSLFKRGVKIMKDEDISKLVDKLDNKTIKTIGLDSEEFLSNPNLCHNCQNWIRTGRVPSIHVSNGLALDEITEEVDLTNLEQQLIARNLIFLKVKKLPRSG